MTLAVRFRPEAAAELADAARWYEDRRVGLGGLFVRAVDAAAEQVCTWPSSGAPVPGQPTLRRVGVGRFPYQLVYTAGDTVIDVLAVAHERRRPGYWTGRADP